MWLREAGELRSNERVNTVQPDKTAVPLSGQLLEVGVRRNPVSALRDELQYVDIFLLLSTTAFVRLQSGRGQFATLLRGRNLTMKQLGEKFVPSQKSVKNALDL